jgi:serine/threonine protein kinase
VEFIIDPPQLVLEFALFGTLADQTSIQCDESITLLQQGLSALEYLHGFSIPIIHRDIKPENILIWSRNPILMKFADFGLSKVGQDLATQCGSPYYQAPEVFSGDRYTSKVDVWSFGLVIFQLAYTLPKPLNSGQKWCRQIVEFPITHEFRPLVDLLTNSMLVMDPECRGSATKCHEDAMELARISRGSTPTQESFHQNNTDSNVSTSLRKSKRTAPPSSSKDTFKRQQTTNDPIVEVLGNGRVQYGSSIAEYLGGDDGSSFSSWGKSSKVSTSRITEQLPQPTERDEDNDLLSCFPDSPLALPCQESQNEESMDSKKSWTESRKNEYMDALLLMPLPGAKSL